jgi:drug/metabolite transporter (DMT)-like permease
MALSILIAGFERGRIPMRGNWGSAIFLATYAIAFSFAYLTLSAGAGALILFAGVQLTMLTVAIHAGERPGTMKWIGMGLAISGIIYLLSPGLQTPPPAGAVLMGCAGIAWGLYSVQGRTSTKPLWETAGNFLRAVPFALVVSIMTISDAWLTWTGVWLAIASGALASGVGYVIWYTALRGLATSQAATAQLLVPVLAAIGGVIFLSESLTLRLVLSTVLVLGGVSLGNAGMPSQARGK